MKTKVVKPTDRNLRLAARIIQTGGLVAFPTETVYGLGANAFNKEAVAKIFEVKERPSFDPIIVHIADIKQIEDLVTHIPIEAEKLIKKFWPGPLTILFNKSDKIPDIVTAGLPKVGIRMPSHPVALKLIKFSKVPIAAPSANKFGFLSPTKVNHILKQLKNKIELVIDAGKSPVGIESTVIDLTENPKILRPGGIPVEEIEKVLGKKVEIINFNKIPDSPGQLKTHYKPKKPLKIIDLNNFVLPEGINAGILLFKKRKNINGFKVVEYLSENGNLKEAASNLFSALHKLEESEIDIIYAEAVPNKGLGIAIMDRLTKASNNE